MVALFNTILYSNVQPFLFQNRFSGKIHKGKNLRLASKRLETQGSQTDFKLQDLDEMERTSVRNCPSQRKAEQVSLMSIQNQPAKRFNYSSFQVVGKHGENDAREKKKRRKRCVIM